MTRVVVAACPHTLWQESAPAGWYDDAYRRLMGEQPRRVLSVITALGGTDVLLADVDVAWLRSPWPALYDARRRHCQVQAMVASSGPAGDARNSHAGDARPLLRVERARPVGGERRSDHDGMLGGGIASDDTHGTHDDDMHDATYDQPVAVRMPIPQANCASCVNAGFLFLRGRAPRVIELVHRWERALRTVHSRDHNQKWLNWVLATGGLPLRTAGARMHEAAARSSWNHSSTSSPAPGGTQWWGSAPSVCLLDPATFVNGHSPLLQEAAVLRDGLLRCRASRTPPPTRAQRLQRTSLARVVQDARAARQGTTKGATRALYVAHLNYALNAQHKICMAKHLGAWLPSPDPVHWRAYADLHEPAVLQRVRAWMTGGDVHDGRVNYSTSTAPRRMWQEHDI